VQPVVGHQNVEPQHAVHGDVENLERHSGRGRDHDGDMLSFGSLVERAMEVFLVTLLGVVLVAHWDWRALTIGGVLFCLIRPLSVALVPWGRCWTAATTVDRLVRHSRDRQPFYYLFYALNHGLSSPSVATLCTDLTLSVVALSIPEE
jgi:hypothetical protein